MFKTDEQLAQKAIDEMKKLIVYLAPASLGLPLPKESVIKGMAAFRAGACCLQELENRMNGIADPNQRI